MTQQNTTTLGSQRLLNIREGMDVYDLTDHKIGKVRSVYFGESSERANEFGLGAATAPDVNSGTPDNFVEDVVEAFTDDERFPEPLRRRLLHDGFIRIDARGLFASDRFALPENIVVVSGDRVTLNVHRDELIKA